MLAGAFAEVIVVGKHADALPLPFPVEDDGSELRAAIVGVVAGLRLAPTELAVVVPTDLPFVTPEFLLELADAAEGVAVAQPESGPLPGAYRRTALARAGAAVGRGRAEAARRRSGARGADHSREPRAPPERKRSG